MKKTYKLLEPSPLLPDLAVGRAYDAEDDAPETVYLVSKKFIEEVPEDAAASAFADAIDQAIGKHMKALAETISKANGRPRGLASEPEPAEPRDGSLGEWVQCISACGPNRVLGADFHSKAIGMLENKYKSKRNPNFQDDFNKSMNMNEAGEIGLGLVSKANVQVESVGSLMGFTVPPEYSPEILKLMGMKSIFLDKVQRRRMTGLDLYIPVIDYSTGAAGVNPFLAGMTGSWVAEGQALPQTNMKLRQLHLKANNFGAYAQESMQLLRDSRLAETILTQNFAQTAAFYWDKAIFDGDGANKPVGMFNAVNPSRQAVNRTAGAGGLLSNCATMDAQLLPEEGSDSRAFWLASPSKFAAITTMNDPSGRIVWLPNFPGNLEGPASKRARLAILGYPLYKSQFPAAAGTATDLVLIDPIGHVAAIREDIEIGASDQFAFTSYLMTYRYIMRGDAQPMLNATITLQNGDVVAPYQYLN